MLGFEPVSLVITGKERAVRFESVLTAKLMKIGSNIV